MPGAVTGKTFLFFFQAEDGIRDDLVTGVQTCALPILRQRKRGLAALHLERALFLDPSDDDARADLQEVRRGNVDKLEGDQDEGGTEAIARILAPLPGRAASVAFVALWCAAWALLGVNG